VVDARWSGLLELQQDLGPDLGSSRQ
jgi:hypothetical protein